MRWRVQLELETAGGTRSARREVESEHLGDLFDDESPLDELAGEFDDIDQDAVTRVVLTAERV